MISSAVGTVDPPSIGALPSPIQPPECRYHVEASTPAGRLFFVFHSQLFFSCLKRHRDFCRICALVFFQFYQHSGARAFAYLCPDGLWDVMTGVEAVELALAAHGRAPSSTGRAPSWADALANGVEGENAEADPANALMKEAVKRGTADNVTAVVVVLPWD